MSDRARNKPAWQVRSLAHRIEEMAVWRAFDRQRANAAVCVDCVTKEKYGQDLPGNLRGLVERLKAKRYRHQPIRRVHIPKDNGKTRPLGISAFDDKLVQDALRAVLHAAYEPAFRKCSFGFRPGRGALDRLRAWRV